MALYRKSILRTGRDYFFITLGMAMYALGFCGFILPEKVVIGGLAGIGTIVYLLTGIDVAYTQFALNMVLLAIAWKVVGKKFVFGTIYGVIMISVFVGIFQPLFANGFTNEPFMNIVLGGLMAGMGVGIAFTHNGSSGGTDIVAAMVSKKSNVTIGRTMLYCDMCIITSSFLIFHQLDKVVYGFVVLVLTSFLCDMVINTNRQAVQFTIISEKWKEIAEAVNKEANRGVTIVDAMGWYSKHPVKMLLVVCRKIESVTIFRIVKSIDEKAFITQANVNGVYGNGFDKLKIKAKPHHDETHPSSPLPERTPQIEEVKASEA